MPAAAVYRHRNPHPRLGLTLVETLVSIGLVAILVSILLPALSSARVTSYRDQCASNQRQIGQAWSEYLFDHNRQFPAVAVQPAWQYAGMRFSGVDETAYPDFERPLTIYLPLQRTRNFHDVCLCCPADRGITASDGGLGTGSRTAFRSFGTSYRANAALLDARLAGLTEDVRGMHRDEITTPPSRLVLMGDPVWYEVAEDTGRDADWHGQADTGNILFLDGSVRFLTVRPRRIIGPVVFDPVMSGSAVEAVPNAPMDSPFPPLPAAPDATSRPDAPEALKPAR